MKKKSRFKTLRTLFFSMLYISAFTFGGGFVIVTLMKQKFVDKLHCMDESEMLDMTAIAQSSPGAIAVNAAILVGWRMAGFAGMITAVIATILPPMVILTAISFGTLPWIYMAHRMRFPERSRRSLAGQLGRYLLFAALACAAALLLAAVLEANVSMKMR